MGAENDPVEESGGGMVCWCTVRYAYGPGIEVGLVGWRMTKVGGKVGGEMGGLA